MMTRRVVATPMTLLLIGLTASCPKSGAPPSLPGAPSPVVQSKPTVDFFSAEPTIVPAGQAFTLRWSARGASHVHIDNNIGEVELIGSRRVQLEGTTHYRLEAANSAGTTVAIATVSIDTKSLGDAKAPQERSGAETAQILATQLQDIHFSYDKEEILESDQAIFEKDAAILKDLIAMDPGVVVIIEGHCDERGSSEYNIALGDRRANFIKNTFLRTGLPGDRLNTVSYGKEQPVCLSLAEDCLARNRRVHFTPAR